LFIGIFAGILAALLRRFGTIALLAAPFIWVFAEFLRYWITGNNWNAVGYSQAYGYEILQSASIGGVYLVSFAVVLVNAFLLWSNKRLLAPGDKRLIYVALVAFWMSFTILPSFVADKAIKRGATIGNEPNATALIIAVQPNVPMNGLDADKWTLLRQQQVDAAEAEVVKLREQGGLNSQLPITVILPESPMNYMYAEDVEFRTFIQAFASRNNVNVLFNSAEPDKANRKYFNSAVMIDAGGRVAAQYDKIYLLPFGEAVPFPLENIMPALVGSFSYGNEYDLLSLGEATAGIMICFESHFGQMGREYARNGADALIEMTNDGYLGPTPVLRQHLANAVFRAVETNRPVLRVTNVGVTAYVNELGDVIDPAHSYSESTRVWTVSKSDGKQTFYVKYGDWFAWLCSIVTFGLLVLGRMSKPKQSEAS
jgi:apolipoprotein N-acyltransferase